MANNANLFGNMQIASNIVLKPFYGLNWTCDHQLLLSRYFYEVEMERQGSGSLTILIMV